MSPAQGHGPEAMAWGGGPLGRLPGPRGWNPPAGIRLLRKRPRRHADPVHRVGTRGDSVWDPGSGRSRGSDSAASGVASGVCEPPGRRRSRQGGGDRAEHAGIPEGTRTRGPPSRGRDRAAPFRIEPLSLGKNGRRHSAFSTVNDVDLSHGRQRLVADNKSKL